MKRIPLTQGQFALVDDEDFEWLSRWKWFAALGGSGYRVMRHKRMDGARRTVYMHREILECPEGVPVDHIDGDELNNQRANLRMATASLNNRNSRRRKPTRLGLPRGVWKNGGRYAAKVSVHSRDHHLGYFDTPAEAHAAYREAREKNIADALAEMLESENPGPGDFVVDTPAAAR